MVTEEKERVCCRLSWRDSGLEPLTLYRGMPLNDLFIRRFHAPLDVLSNERTEYTQHKLRKVRPEENLYICNDYSSQNSLLKRNKNKK